MQGDGTQTRCRGMDEFQIGDFVWGKIHGELWWPGRVCDPSDASKQARNSEHLDHHVLVAYFGDDTFGWCEASLLRPFKEEFQQMLEQNGSQSFIDAVKDAIYEVEICLRSDMTCYCVPPEKVVQFRAGRKNDICNASVCNYSPVEFLNHLQDVSRDISVANMLEITLMRSWASSFYIRNGCFIKMVEDLFDEKQTDLNASPGKPYKDKRGREFRMNGGRVVRRPQISRDEASRKKRSVAELIMLAEEEKVGTLKDETKGLYKKKKRRDKVKDMVSGVENDEENVSTRRERKKSKYLSPPYTSGHRERSNSFKVEDSEASEDDSESFLNLQTLFPTHIEDHGAPIKEDDPATNSSPHDMLGILLFAASNPLHLVRNTPTETVREFFVKHRGFAYSGILHQNGEKVIDDNEKTDDCLNGVDASKARLKPRGKRGFGEAVEEGRLEERRNKTRHIVKDGKMRNSEDEHLSSTCHKRKNNPDVTNGEQSIDFDSIKYDNSGKSVFRSKRARHVESSIDNSVALLLTFPSRSSLPSKRELFLVFSKYGALIEHETELFRDPGCARVVFAREADAKKAMNVIKKSNDFPFSVLDCQSFDLRQCPDIPSWSESGPSAELKSISQDLQSMITTLSPKKGHFSHGLKPEARKDLISDIKSLLNKVNKLMTL